MKYFLWFVILFTACNDKYPPCPAPLPEELKPGLYSKELGAVQVDGETCHIFEQYGTWDCEVVPGYQCRCEGVKIRCSRTVLTRTTKCVSGKQVNGVTQTGGKFSHEEVH